MAGDSSTAQAAGRRLALDAAALILIVSGLTGLTFASWRWHPLAGLAFTSLLALTAGVFLGVER